MLQSDFLNDFDSLFTDYRAQVMATDVRETKGATIFEIELPGFVKEDIRTDLEDGCLTITATRKEQNEASYRRRERRFGTFARRFYIGRGVAREDIKAKFQNGILTIVIPKESIGKVEEKNIVIE